MKRVKMYAPKGGGSIEVLPSKVEEMEGKGYTLNKSKKVKPNKEVIE